MKASLPQKPNKLFPLYAIVPGLACIVLNLLVYNGNRLLTSGWKHYDLSLPIDGAIPLLPWTIIVYVLFFPFLAVGFLGLAREGKAFYYRVVAGENIAKLLCLVFFLALPTRMPDWPGNEPFEIRGFSDWLLRLIYDLDEPDNLFPSIHCLESWLIMRKSLQCKKLPTGYKIGISVVAVGIMLSTLTTRQHLVLDIVGGIAAAEIGQFISQKLDAGRIYFRLEKALSGRKKTTWTK